MKWGKRKMMSEDRKSFQELPAVDNLKFLKDGEEIFKMMKNKYPKNSVEDLDNLLNGICASLVILISNHVDEDKRKSFVQLIYKILYSNI